MKKKNKKEAGLAKPVLVKDRGPGKKKIKKKEQRARCVPLFLPLWPTRMPEPHPFLHTSQALGQKQRHCQHGRVNYRKSILRYSSRYMLLLVTIIACSTQLYACEHARIEITHVLLAVRGGRACAGSGVDAYKRRASVANKRAAGLIKMHF